MRWTPCVLWALLGACGNSSSPGAPDEGVPSDGAVDAPVARDGARDASAGDATAADAPVPDSGAVDAPGEDRPDGGSEDVSTPDAGVDAGLDASDDSLGPAAACFASEFVHAARVGPDYDAIPGVRIGTHCRGTDHQDIDAPERVVFLGDSVTVGSPPTGAEDWYRVVLAERLAARFSLEREEGLLNGFRWEQWIQANPLEGTTVVRESGDFASCAKWGARADDLRRDNRQLEDCFPERERGKRQLAVLTVGGNDLNSLSEEASDGASAEELWSQTREYVALVRDAVEWLKDPVRFPAGVDVVFANVYEFTDATGDVGACDTAAIAGFDGDADLADALAEMVVWANEQYMQIAVDTGSDLVFLLETFCGHGFRRDDPTSPCYRGPGAELYFDLTCIHPNARGHEVIADLFMSVVEE